jgi:zinc protease
VRVPRPERITLANGLKLVLIPRRGLPHLSLKLVVPAGSVAEPAERAGSAALLAALLTEGTPRLGANALHARLDALGAAVHAEALHDAAVVEAHLLSETAPEALALLGETVLDPALPERELERVRAETLDALEARGDEPANLADDRLALEIFGAAHPYGRLVIGSEMTLEEITRADLFALHAARYRPGGSVLVAAGDFDVDDFAALVERALAGWSGAAAPVGYPPLPAALASGRRVEEPWEDAAQAEIRIGTLGMRRDDPEWIAGAVANYILGGSTITGRLGANLREAKGWTYGARSGFAAAIQPGGWAAETAVDVAVADAAVREMLDEMRHMRDALVPAEELRRAKDALILSLPHAFETPGAVVNRFVTIETFGLPADYWERYAAAVEAVQAEDVARIAQRYFDAERAVQVMVGTPRAGEVG